MTTTKSRNGGKWTQARFRAFVVSALRAASRRWPVKYEVLKKACVGRQVNEATGKLALHYRCNSCQGLFTSSNVAVDHIDPVVATEAGFVSWDEFIERLFCEENGLQVLCKPCHTIKTANERKERKDAGGTRRRSS